MPPEGAAILEKPCSAENPQSPQGTKSPVDCTNEAGKERAIEPGPENERAAGQRMLSGGSVSDSDPINGVQIPEGVHPGRAPSFPGGGYRVPLRHNP